MKIPDPIPGLPSDLASNVDKYLYGDKMSVTKASFGFREFTVNKQINPYAARHFQKRMPNIGGREIFINVWEYASITLNSGTELPPQFEVEVQLQNLFDHRAVNVKIFTYDSPRFNLMEIEAMKVIHALLEM